MTVSAPLQRRDVLALAWPVMLAQAASALPGVVDTAVMGRVGTAVELAAVGVGAVIFSFLYWGFGFLRMSTTGLTAQARGAGETDEVQALLVRGLVIGAALGLGLQLAYPWLRTAALWAFSASPAVEAEAAAYMDARIVGAPAALLGFAVQGWLLGVGRTRALLAYQLVLNGGNAVLDAVFVGSFGWGAAGIGAGTATAEWAAAVVGLGLVWRSLGRPAGLWDRGRLRRLFSANVDVLVRTLALLSAFAWFVDGGAGLGDAEAAGNQVLLQFVAVSAFVLDSFAFIAEKEAGEAVGAGSRARFDRAARVTTELALAAGAGFAALYWIAGGPLIEAVVQDPEARRVALAHLPWCAAVPLVGVPAWQLDGLFLGATRGRALRNAAVVATVAYIGLDLVLRPAFGNAGLWWAFVVMYLLRAVALGAGLPGLRRALGPAPVRG
jgi:MATE family multidrug resistance protein